MQKNKSRYTVIVSEEAEAMLLDHTRFLARVNVSAANGLVSDFLELVASLETMPERFSTFVRSGHRLEGYYKALFAKRYLAIFCIEGQSVYLDFVVDCRKENDELLKDILS